ncbi:MAG: family 20 glycosylhydrolase [Spirosomataceae bacterium]
MKLLRLVLMLFPLWVNAQKKTVAFQPANLSIDWQLVTNHHNGEDQFLYTLTLTNTDKKLSLPATGWTIYYNANRDVIKKDVGHGLEMFRVHGDLFYLRPTTNFKGIKPGESIVLQCIGDAWAFNISDAPAGYYWVWDNAPTTSIAITKTTARPPADINKFKRSPNQPNDQITPQMVFEQNKSIVDIPAEQLPRILPTPVSYLEQAGSFTITASTTIVSEGAFEQEARYLADELEVFLGAKLSVGTISSNTIVFRTDASLAPEAYRLHISPSGIEIAAATPAGAFYGIQSLKSLLPLTAWKSPMSSLSVSCALINDSPRFGYRGLHVDVARNFQTKAQLFRVLNWMALYKLNKLHFHFSEDDAWRLEIPALPELTSVGAKRGHTLDSKTHMPASYGSGGDINNPQSDFYTRQDYLDILRFAKARHIEVIPEIETPGHARAAIKAMNARYERLMQEGKPEEANAYLLADPSDQSVYLSAQYFTDNVMCIALPSVYRFLETTLDAIMAMHQEAGMPLKTIHMGGDEVPAGVWEKSPLCQALLKQLPADKYKQTSDLWIYYWEKVNQIVKQRGLYLSGWEEMGMRESKVDDNKVMMVNPTFANQNFHTYVWNTVIGWGTEDLPYRLANGGYKVILCPVSNLYFDLAYQKDFDEVGYYWGGFVDTDKPFYFIPFDYLKNTKVDRFGNPIDPKTLQGKDRLTDYGKTNIVGIQGHLWSENIRSAGALEYAAFPKVLALAERAWAADPEWATTKNTQQSETLYQKAWSIFVNTVGKRELFKLNYYQGGANFRIPTVGAKTENGAIIANIQLPGMTIRYTTDGSEPTPQSKPYEGPITQKGVIRLRAFDAASRGSRTIQVSN